MDIRPQIEDAYARIISHVRPTSCEYSPYYSKLTGNNVFLKTENLQHTGSFKVRGALNKLLSLSADEIKDGVITASTGNHGAAVAFAAAIVGTKATVFVSPNSSKSKVDGIRRLGADVREHGDDPIEAENFARKYAQKNGLPYISPYNDIAVVAGQASIGMELTNQLSAIDAVFIALGGGGLISGVGSYLKSASAETNIIGCSPENSKVMIQSVEMGSLHGNLPSTPTLSDGTAGGIEDESITFELCRNVTDSFVTVTEGEISSAMVEFMDTHHMQIEGAAAVAIASFLKTADLYDDKNIVIVLCGANIGVETLRKVLNAGT